MKTLLICPAIRPAVPQLATSGPLATTPLLGESLLNFWLEHVAQLGAKHVVIVSADRPEAVRASVADGKRWGVQIEVVHSAVEPTVAEASARYRPDNEAGWLPAPHDVILMSHLPGEPNLPLFESYAAWFAALQAWIPKAVTPARVRMREMTPGIWVGSRARIAPGAKLVAPCWIGDYAQVADGATVGPNAILEDRAVVEPGARVESSVVSPDTFVGRFTVVAQSLANGDLLINWRTDSSLRVPDPFLMCSLAKAPAMSPTGRLARTVQAFARAATLPVNLVAGLFSRPNREGNFKLPG